MYSWFAQQSNPYQKGAYTGYSATMRSWQWDAHAWARQAFASNFTQSGFSSVAFASSRKDMLRGMFRHKVKAGSPEHVRRLHHLAARVPGAAPDVRKALGKLSQPTGKFSKFGKALGPLAMVGFAAQAAYSEQGPASAKVGAAIGMTAGMVGWEAGATAGTSLGAAAGSFLGPLGTLVGAAAGYLVGGLAGFAAVDEASKFAASIPQRLVDRERTRRRLNWATPNPAFYTQQAATMRQASLQAMNRGLMTSRSAMGQEAVFVHS